MRQFSERKTHRSCSMICLLFCAMLMAGCTMSSERMDRLEDVDLDADAPGADLQEAPDAAETPIFRSGLFGALLGRRPSPETDPTEAPTEDENPSEARDDVLMANATSDVQSDKASDVAAPLDSPENAQEDRGTDASEVTTVETVQAPTAAPARTGFFARLLGSTPAAADDAPRQAAIPDLPRARDGAPDVTRGAPLAFGTYGRVCGLSRRDMGIRVERFPEKARSGGYALYDSAPGSIAPRAFYITGFADGCARQVTAANVIFGAPSMHERLRYGLPAGTLPASHTDEAYKTLKSRICRVPRSAPCGDRITRLERNTVFVTMYESFSNNRNWSNLLLHDGAVLASDIKGRG